MAKTEVVVLVLLVSALIQTCVASLVTVVDEDTVACTSDDMQASLESKDNSLYLTTCNDVILSNPTLDNSILLLSTLTDFDSEVETLKNDASNMQNQLDALTGSLSEEIAARQALESNQVQSIHSAVQDLGVRLSDSESNIGDLQSEVTTLKQAAANNEAVNELSTRLMSLETVVSETAQTTQQLATCAQQGKAITSEGDCVLSVCPTPTVDTDVVRVMLPWTIQPETHVYWAGTTVFFECIKDTEFLEGGVQTTCLPSLEWSEPWPTECTPYTVCEPGQFVKTQPTKKSDRECDNCPEGFYSDVENAETCQPIIDCPQGQYEKTAPTESSNRVCEECPSGKFSTTTNAKACADWKVCQPGTYVTQPSPSATSDRQCQDCDTETFSTGSNADSCTTAKKCNQGQYASKGPTETSDRTCSSCSGNTWQENNNFVGTSCKAIGKATINNCQHSSAHPGGYGCQNAYDGDWNDGGGNAWATHGQGNGAWIRLHFDRAMWLNQIRYKQRNCACEWFRRIRLEFSNGDIRHVDLPNNQGPNTLSFTWAGPATHVRIVAETSWSRTNNGANEIELYGIAD